MRFPFHKPATYDVPRQRSIPFKKQITLVAAHLYGIAVALTSGLHSGRLLDIYHPVNGIFLAVLSNKFPMEHETVGVEVGGHLNIHFSTHNQTPSSSMGMVVLFIRSTVCNHPLSMRLCT